MFGSSFNRDPFCRLPIPSAFSYSNYIVPSSAHYQTPQDAHNRRRQHRHMPQPHPRHHSPQPRHRRLPRRPSHSSHIPPSSLEQDTSDEAYYMDTSSPSPLHSRMHNRGQYWKHNDRDSDDNGDNNNSLDLDSAFIRTPIKFPQRTADLLRKDEILILPPTLTRMRVQMRRNHATEVLRATVAGDMRFRDVVKQLVPAGCTGEVRAYVKMRGAWQEPGLFLLSQIVEQGRFVLNERGEVDVKIEFGRRGGGGRGGGDGGSNGGFGQGGRSGIEWWERESERGRKWAVRDV